MSAERAPRGAATATMRASEELDAVILRERGWCDVAALRLYAHPAFPYVFPVFLAHVYHGMRTAIGVMEAALARCAALAPHCRVADRLVPYWTEHIRAELGHDGWLLEDMRRLGIDVEAMCATPPDPAVAELIGTLHFWILHTHPVAALAYFYIAERGVPNQHLVNQMAQAAGVPPEYLRTFQRHAEIDIDHGHELQELLDSLPLTGWHRALLSLSAAATMRQLSRMLQSLLERADSALVVPADA